jgi:outer membrane biosynthesis protein TonB
MANPFKEAEKKNKKAPGSAQEPVVEKKEVEVVETPAEPEKPAETPEKPVVKVEEKKAAPKKAEKKAAEPEKKAVDIFASLEAEKSTGKTYAFYLSEVNAQKLKDMAAKKGISTSKLLDHILSQVL